nr:uncharacterized protein LOC108068191 [Drosophila takahashii]
MAGSSISMGFPVNWLSSKDRNRKNCWCRRNKVHILRKDRSRGHTRYNKDHIHRNRGHTHRNKGPEKRIIKSLVVLSYLFVRFKKFTDQSCVVDPLDSVDPVARAAVLADPVDPADRAGRAADHVDHAVDPVDLVADHAVPAAEAVDRAVLVDLAAVPIVDAEQP